MKIVIHKDLVQQLLRWTQYVLLAGGVAMLGYCGFVLVDSWLYQTRMSQEFEHRLEEESPGFRAAVDAREPAPLAAPAVIGPDGVIGRLEIPRLGISVVVSEGIASKTLRHAVGHIENTALPGEIGNVGIAGHRDTFFRPLKDIRRDDGIIVTTLGGKYHYRVVSTEVVSPYEVGVLDATGGEVLTLVTCYPFYFVGSAPERFIVRAERSGSFEEASRALTELPLTRR